MDSNKQHYQLANRVNLRQAELNDASAMVLPYCHCTMADAHVNPAPKPAMATCTAKPSVKMKSILNALAGWSCTDVLQTAITISSLSHADCQCTRHAMQLGTGTSCCTVPLMLCLTLDSIQRRHLAYGCMCSSLTLMPQGGSSHLQTQLTNKHICGHGPDACIVKQQAAAP